MISPQNNLQSNPLIKNQQLNQLMKQCNYREVGQINIACQQIFNAYPDIVPCLQTMKNQNTTQNVIELCGNIGIKILNNTYFVLTHITFTPFFPSSPPVIRIKNTNPDKICVSQKYLPFYTSDYFILLQLSESQTWTHHQSIIRLLQQMQKELSEVFPFYEQKQQFQNAMGQQNPQQPQQQQQQQIGSPSYGQNYNNQITSNGYNPQQQQQGYPYGNNPYQQQQQNNGPYSNSPFNNNFQPPPNPFSPVNNNNNIAPAVVGIIPQQQQQQQQQQGMNLQSNNYDYQQVQNRVKGELEVTLKQLLEEFGEEKKSADQIYQLKQKLDENEVILNQVEEELQTKIHSIQQQILSLDQFTQQNDSVTITKDNASNYINQSNPLQTQILELSSEQDAIKETLIYAEEAFNSNRIDYETLMKTVQQFAEQEFNVKVMLKKCVAAQNKK